MTRKKDIPQVKNPPGGDGHYITYRDMTPSELAEREAGQLKYEAMLARQAAYEKERWATVDKAPLPINGSVFAKSCKLSDGVIDYSNPNGYVPADLVRQYGDLVWLGGRRADASGTVPLKQIGAGTITASLGRLALGGTALEATGATVGGTVVTGLLTGMVALLWPSSLGDSSLYSEEQLSDLKQARSRMRLQIEQQADGSLKGYGFYTGQNRDWEMVDVVHLVPRADHYVADLGDGIELIWTPAVDPSDTLGIPALEAAPQAPPIWIYPPTPMADSIIVDPIYPPEYRDFILVFPADSGVRPVYAVLSVRRKGLAEAGHDYHPAPKTQEIVGFPDLKRGIKKTPVQGGGGLRHRWLDAKGRTIYEWDSSHGELEAYRSSDGSHLGAFDHVTGEQTKAAQKNRNIKKYL